MNVQERIRMCRLVEKMENQREFSKRLCLENISSFHGKPIQKMIEERK